MCPDSDDVLDHLKCRDCKCPCHEGRKLFEGIKFRREKTRVFLSSPERPYTKVYRVENDAGDGPFRRVPTDDNGSPWTRGPWANSCWYGRKGRSCIMTLGPDDTFDDETLIRFNFFGNWEYHEDEGTTYHMYRNKFLYAFENRQQVKLWFSRRDLKVMRKFGFRIRPRKASIVLYSPVQCAFIPYEEGEQPALTISSSEVHT